MKFCPRCGKENVEEADFCRHCGAPFPKTESPTSPVPPEKDKKPIPKKMIIAVSVLVCAIAVAIGVTVFLVTYECPHKKTVDLPAVAPTCTKIGLTAGKQCAKCDAIVVPQETVPVLGHEYTAEEIVKQSTCAEKGIKRKTCSRCGETEDTELPFSNDHTFTETVTQEATCTEYGEIRLVCKTCGYQTIKRTDRKAHSYKSTEYGWGYCVNCGLVDFEDNAQSISELLTKWESDMWYSNGDDVSAVYCRNCILFVDQLFEATGEVQILITPVCSGCHQIYQYRTSEWLKKIVPNREYHWTYHCETCGADTDCGFATKSE